jgi:hypothetical protein
VQGRRRTGLFREEQGDAVEINIQLVLPFVAKPAGIMISQKRTE